MYCSSCGIEYVLGLNYCNRCGANLSPSPIVEPEIRAGSLTKPTIAVGLIVVLITLGGFALMIGGAIELANVFHQKDPVMAIIMMGMLTILVGDIMLIRLLSRLINASLQTKRPAQLKMPAASEQRPAQIGAARSEPIPSVTEHTTRAFEPVFRTPVEREQRSKMLRKES